MDREALLAVAAAFLAGAALERHRQAQRPRPPSLRETPRAWWDAVHASVGLRRSVAAGLVLAGAVALLALPSSLELGGSGSSDAKSDSPTGPRGPLPRVRVLRREVGEAFELAGARFLIHRAERRQWARGLLRRRARRGHRWIALQVEVRNVSHRRLDAHSLSYRLRASNRTPYEPLIAGGTGPRSIAHGGLRRGELGVARLAFQAPMAARRLALVFEPPRDGARQVVAPIRPSPG